MDVNRSDRATNETVLIDYGPGGKKSPNHQTNNSGFYFTNNNTNETGATGGSSGNKSGHISSGRNENTNALNVISFPPVPSTNKKNLITNLTNSSSSPTTTIQPSESFMNNSKSNNQILNTNVFNTDNNNNLNSTTSVAIMMKPMPAQSTTTTTTTTTLIPSSNMKKNEKFINLGLESIKINGVVQFKQLRNPLNISKDSTQKENILSNNTVNYGATATTGHMTSSPPHNMTTTTTTTTTIIKPSNLLNKTKCHSPIAQTNNNSTLTFKSASNNLKNDTGSVESLAYSDNEVVSYASANLNPSLSKYENTNDETSLKTGLSTSITNDKQNSVYNNINNNIINYQMRSSISELEDGGGGGVGVGANAGARNLSINNNVNNSNSNSRGVLDAIGGSKDGTGNSNRIGNNIGNAHIDNENTALCQSTHLGTRSLSNGSNRKEKKTSVGYRLGKRKLLFEKRRKISDYALLFAMIGVILMVMETEFSMAKIYTKVKTIKINNYLIV